MRLPKAKGDISRTLSLAGLTGGALVLNLAFSIFTAREMAPAGRGIVALAITIGTTTSLVCSLGINVSARHYLPQRRPDVTLSDYQGVGAILLVAQTLVAAVISVATMQRSAGGAAVTLTTVYSAASFVSFIYLDALNAFGRLQSAQLVSVLGSLIQLVAVVLVKSGGELSVTRALVALCTGPALQGLACIVALVCFGEMRVPRLRRAGGDQLVRKGLPALGMNASQSLTFRLDRYVVAAVLGNTQLGIYAVAVAGSEALRAIPFAWSQIQFYKIAAGGMNLDALARHRRRLILLMCPVLVVWGLLAPWILATVVGSDYASAATPWRILLIGELGVMAYQIDSRIMAARGYTRPAGRSGALGLAVVLPLDLLMIPLFGLTGAAAASAIAYTVMGVVAARACRRVMTLPTHSEQIKPAELALALENPDSIPSIGSTEQQ